MSLQEGRMELEGSVRPIKRSVLTNEKDACGAFFKGKRKIKIF